MVAFNPSTGNTQEQGIGPFGITHDVGPLHGDQSGRYAGKGLGEVPSLFNEASRQYGESVKTEVHNRVEPIIEQRIASLQQDLTDLTDGQARLQPPGHTTSQQSRRDASQILLPSEHDNEYAKPPGAGGGTPDDVKQGLNDIRNIVGAKRSGKLSPSQTDMQVMSILKDMRGQYPGYRDVIDETAGHIMGRSIAARTMASLQSDVNSFVEARNAAKSNVLSRLDNRDLMAAFSTHPEDWLRLRQMAADTDDPERLKQIVAKADMIAAPAMIQYYHNIQAEQMYKAKSEEQKFDREQVTSMLAARTSIKDNNDLIVALTGGDYPTAEHHDALAKKEETGTEEERIELAHNLDLKRQRKEVEWLQHLNTVVPGGDGRTFGQYLGEDATKWLESQRKPWNEAVAAAGGKNYSELGYKAAALKASQAAIQYDMFKNSQTYALLTTMAANNPEFAKTKEFLDMMNKFASEGGPDGMKAKFAQAYALLGNPDGTFDDGSKKKTWKDTIDDAIKDKVKAKDAMKSFDSIAECVAAKDCPAAVVKNFVENLDSPGAFGNMSKGFTDPVTHRWIQGNSDVHQKFYGDPRIHHMVLAKTDQEGYQKFYNTWENSLATEVWSDPIQDLSREVASTKDGHPYVNIIYDTDQGQLIAQPAISEKDLEYAGETGVLIQRKMEKIQDSVKILNQGLAEAALFYKNWAKMGQQPPYQGNPAILAAMVFHNAGLELEGVPFQGSLADQVAQVFFHAVKQKTEEEKQEEEDVMESTKQMAPP